MTGPQTAVGVVVELPLPHGDLGPNGRVHWARRARLTNEHRMGGYAAIVFARCAAGITDYPWPAVRMDIHWRCAGVIPDSDNIVARCKAYRDGAADAGLVADDRDIHVGTVTFDRVKRADQCVVLTFTRTDSERQGA